MTVNNSGSTARSTTGTANRQGGSVRSAMFSPKEILSSEDKSSLVEFGCALKTICSDEASTKEKKSALRLISKRSRFRKESLRKKIFKILTGRSDDGLIKLVVRANKDSLILRDGQTFKIESLPHEALIIGLFNSILKGSTGVKMLESSMTQIPSRIYNNIKSFLTTMKDRYGKDIKEYHDLGADQATLKTNALTMATLNCLKINLPYELVKTTYSGIKISGNPVITDEKMSALLELIQKTKLKTDREIIANKSTVIPQLKCTSIQDIAEGRRLPAAENDYKKYLQTISNALFDICDDKASDKTKKSAKKYLSKHNMQNLLLKKETGDPRSAGLSLHISLAKRYLIALEYKFSEACSATKGLLHLLARGSINLVELSR